LMQSHGCSITFSSTKPNVIVGPNGSGKTALMTALSLATLTHFIGTSTLERAYANHFDAQALWSKASSRDQDAQYLPGLSFDSDFGPAIFYRPHHIPGNDHHVSAAMMTGYFNEAREFGLKTRNKSSGQASLALLELARRTLRGEHTPSYATKDWPYGKDRTEITYGMYDPIGACRANVLIERYLNLRDATPVVLLDEPEQSLDALSHIALW